MLSKIFNKVGGAAQKVTKKLGDIFDNSMYFERGPDGRMMQVDKFSEKPVQQQPIKQIPPGTVDPALLGSAIRYLESSGGTHPDTPRNQRLEYTIPAYNQNEKPRTVQYDIGHAGEYGLTSIGLAELAKSKPNKDAPQSEFTQYGAPLIPGRKPEEIQQMIMSPEGAGELAVELFNMRRQMKGDYTPESLARDYMDYYMSDESEHYTPENYQKVLDYFKTLVAQK